MIATEDAKRSPYDPCPCGSGQKFRFCHGNRAPQSPFSELSLATPAPHDSVHSQPPPSTSSGGTQIAIK